jgi:hypothetical protein
MALRHYRDSTELEANVKRFYAQASL